MNVAPWLSSWAASLGCRGIHAMSGVIVPCLPLLLVTFVNGAMTSATLELPGAVVLSTTILCDLQLWPRKLLRQCSAVSIPFCPLSVWSRIPPPDKSLLFGVCDTGMSRASRTKCGRRISQFNPCRASWVISLPFRLFIAFQSLVTLAASILRVVFYVHVPDDAAWILS